MALISRIHLFINPRSGPWLRRLFGQANEHQSLFPDIEIRRISLDEFRQNAPSYLAEMNPNTDVVGISGGDGSVNFVINQPELRAFPILILPQGSGNGFARHLRIPLEPQNALTLVKNGRILRCDSGDINGRRFASLAGIGFDALVAEKYNRLRQRGWLTYAYVIVREFFRYKARTYLLQLDGKRIRTNALFIVFANGGQFGYNTQVAPQASVTDGFLDVVIFKHISLKDIPDFIRNVLEGRLSSLPWAEIYRAREIRVLGRKGRTVNVDGEAVRMSRKLHIRVLPESLRVFVPKDHTIEG